MPVLGYLDDLLIVPAGIALCIRLIPGPVMDECRGRATAQESPVSRAAAVVIGIVWALVAAWVVLTVVRVVRAR